MMNDEQVRDIVLSAGEASGIDFKGPLNWADVGVAPKLAKHIAAMSNTRGGGVLVIGVKEYPPGVFDRCGLQPDDASSFDTTNMANWINARFEPDIHISCYRTEIDGNTFIVIDVDEFDEIPVICTKTCRVEGERKDILESGRIYVRTANAESVPLSTPKQLRRLISVAALKKRDEMVSALQSVIDGVPRNQPTTAEKYATDRSELEEALKHLRGERAENPCWSTELIPKEFSGDRLTLSEIAEAVRVQTWNARMAVGEPRAFGNGIAAGTGQRGIGMTTSGLIIAYEAYIEDREDFKSLYVGEAMIDRRRWFGYFHSIWRATRQFEAIAGLAASFTPGTAMSIVVSANEIDVRRLVSESVAATLGPRFDQESIARSFDWSIVVSREELASGWPRLCSLAVAALTQRFSPEGIDASIIEKIIVDAG